MPKKVQVFFKVSLYLFCNCLLKPWTLHRTIKLLIDNLLSSTHSLSSRWRILENMTFKSASFAIVRTLMSIKKSLYCNMRMVLERKRFQILVDCNYIRHDNFMSLRCLLFRIQPAKVFTYFGWSLASLCLFRYKTTRPSYAILHLFSSVYGNGCSVILLLIYRIIDKYSSSS